MNDSTLSDINNSTFSTFSNNTTNTDTKVRKNTKVYKQIWQLGKKHLVVVDESIIQKLGITEDSTFFVEQELTKDNTTILMRVKIGS